MRRTMIISVGLVAILAACTSAGSSPTSATSAAPSVASSASPDVCAPAQLALVTAGKLTIGTDNPAYPPYFAENGGGTKTAPWELGDPTNGKGFESAVGYAVADRMGFAKTDVTWVVVIAFSVGQQVAAAQRTLSSLR